MIKTNDFIEVDENNGRIVLPKLLLMTKSFEVISNINHFSNWNMSVIANGLDEISFEVNKYINNELCPFWDDLIDLKVVDVNGKARFEIEVDYTDNTETVKSVHGVSLECELGQLYLNEFHVNDETAMIYNQTVYSNEGEVLVTGNYSKDFDVNGNFIPTVFYKPDDTDHSLLHRVLADKAPNWSLGQHITEYIALDEEGFEAELSSTFQRTYTVDGTSIYDFLTDSVAKESNVAFIFDTVNRLIDCYSLSDGYVTNYTDTVISEGVLDNVDIEDGIVYQQKLNLDCSEGNIIKVDDLVDSITIKAETDHLKDNGTITYAGANNITTLDLTGYETLTCWLGLSYTNALRMLLVYNSNNNVINVVSDFTSTVRLDVSDAAYATFIGPDYALFYYYDLAEEVTAFIANIVTYTGISVDGYDVMSLGDITNANNNYKPTLLLANNDNEVIDNYIVSDTLNTINVSNATLVIVFGRYGSNIDYSIESNYSSNEFVITTSSTGVVDVSEYDVLNIKAAYEGEDYKTIEYHIIDTDYETGTRQKVMSAVGEDTFVLVSKDKLAQEIGVESDKDSIKNCFRVSGGDDMITAAVAAVNMNGTNYIYRFADFQLNDMSDELQEKISDYQELYDTKQEEYNNTFKKLQDAYQRLAYYQSGMSPSTALSETTAEEVYNTMRSRLEDSNFKVAAYDFDSYTDNYYAGVTNNVKDMAKIFGDSRYEVEIINGKSSFNKASAVWSGQIRVTRTIDKEDTYPLTTAQEDNLIHVKIQGVSTIVEQLEYAKQKVMKALESRELAGLTFNQFEVLDTTTKDEFKQWLSQFALSYLKSYRDAFEGCRSVIMTCRNNNPDQQVDILGQLYARYNMFYEVADSLYNMRLSQVQEIQDEVNKLEKQNLDIQDELNFARYLGTDLYKEFNNYVREDDYQNDNFISDNLNTVDALMDKAKELLEAAQQELKKACVLQRQVETTCQNMVLLPEFESLFEHFNLYNYIRVKTDDEIFKLRIIQIDFDGDSFSDIKVTFSDKVETIDGNVSDTESLLNQVASISSSYSSTMLQASQGQKANNFVNNLYNNGLNAAQTMISNADNNEVTITSSGIIAKRMDDTGFYGDKQLRIIGNGIYMTDDNWHSVKMAIGETTFTNPLTHEEYQDYGIIAPNIVGHLIAGERLVISAKNGDVVIDDNGITLANDQAITFETGGLVKNSDFETYKLAVRNTLEGSGTSVITQDSIISPKIGGGYLYIAGNDGSSIEINPQGLNTGHSAGQVLASGNVEFMYSEGPPVYLSLTNGSNINLDSIEYVDSNGDVDSWDLDDNSTIDYDIFSKISNAQYNSEEDKYVLSSKFNNIYKIEVSNLSDSSEVLVYATISDGDDVIETVQILNNDSYELSQQYKNAGYNVTVTIKTTRNPVSEAGTLIYSGNVDLFMTNVVVSYGHYERIPVSGGAYRSQFVGKSKGVFNVSTFRFPVTLVDGDSYYISVYGTSDSLNKRVDIRYSTTSTPPVIMRVKDAEGKEPFTMDLSGNIKINGYLESGGGFFNENFGVAAASVDGGAINGLFTISNNNVKIGADKNNIDYGLNNININASRICQFNSIDNNNKKYEFIYHDSMRNGGTAYNNAKINATWFGGNTSASGGTSVYTALRGNQINIFTQYNANMPANLRRIRLAVDDSSGTATQMILNASGINITGNVYSDYISANSIDTNQSVSANILSASESVSVDGVTIDGYNFSSSHFTRIQNHVVLGYGSGTPSQSVNFNLYADNVYSNNNNASSDERIKDIYNIETDKINKLYAQLKPIEYIFKNDEDKLRHFGFGAQSINKALDGSGLKHSDFGIVSDVGTKYVDYNNFIALNTFMIQQLITKIEKLEEKVYGSNSNTSDDD